MNTVKCPKCGLRTSRVRIVEEGENVEKYVKRSPIINLDCDAESLVSEFTEKDFEHETLKEGGEGGIVLVTTC